MMRTTSCASSANTVYRTRDFSDTAFSGWGCSAEIHEDGDISADIQDTTQALGRGEPVKVPFALPDLVVAVNTPAQIQQGVLGNGQSALVEIRVDNTLTPLGGSAADGVGVRVNFADLEAVGVQANSGFQCSLEYLTGKVNLVGAPASHSVVCTGGAIPADGSATISVAVKEGAAVYNGDELPGCIWSPVCGPAYTDAWVDPSNAIAERSETNNRTLGVTDITNCNATY